jgi:hypothetical protein
VGDLFDGFRDRHRLRGMSLPDSHRL